LAWPYTIKAYDRAHYTTIEDGSKKDALVIAESFLTSLDYAHMRILLDVMAYSKCFLESILKDHKERKNDGSIHIT